MQLIQSGSGENALEELAYIVSHDVRASARALREVPEWICEDLADSGLALPEDVAANLSLLTRHAARLDLMLTELLTYSRIGRLGAAERVDLANLLEEERLPPGGLGDLQVTVQGQPGAVMMPKGEAQLLVRSLIRNAAQHGRPGGRLLIRARKSGPDVVLRFEDDGPGIAAEQLPLVFKPMKTLARFDEGEGCGMGLALVARIVECHGGKLRAGKSESFDNGLAVEITLPGMVE